MKVNNNPALDAYQRMAVSSVGSTNVAQPTAPVAEVRSAAPQVAKVSISSQARELAKSSTQGAYDAEKVESLTNKLSTGTLEFDSKTIAARMLAALG